MCPSAITRRVASLLPKHRVLLAESYKTQATLTGSIYYGIYYVRTNEQQALKRLSSCPFPDSQGIFDQMQHRKRLYQLHVRGMPRTSWTCLSDSSRRGTEGRALLVVAGYKSACWMFGYRPITTCSGWSR